MNKAMFPWRSRQTELRFVPFIPRRPQFGMNHLKKEDASSGETQQIPDVFMREETPTESEVCILSPYQIVAFTPALTQGTQRGF